MENPGTQENPGDQTDSEPIPTENLEDDLHPNVSMGSAFFEREYEIIKQK